VDDDQNAFVHKSSLHPPLLLHILRPTMYTPWGRLTGRHGIKRKQRNPFRFVISTPTVLEHQNPTQKGKPSKREREGFFCLCVVVASLTLHTRLLSQFRNKKRIFLTAKFYGRRATYIQHYVVVEGNQGTCLRTSCSCILRVEKNAIALQNSTFHRAP